MLELYLDASNRGPLYYRVYSKETILKWSSIHIMNALIWKTNITNQCRSKQIKSFSSSFFELGFLGKKNHPFCNAEIQPEMLALL